MVSTSHATTWVVIPTYNERGNVESVIDKIFSQKIPGLNLLIVDDNSPDGTSEAVQQLRKSYPLLQLLIRDRKEGLGKAYVHGFQYALDRGATKIVQMDADLSHNPLDVPRLLAQLSTHDVVVGSRYSNGISVINWPLKRLLISITGNVYAGFVTGLPFKDATGGFRAWRAEALRRIDLSSVTTDGYGFQITTLFRAWKSGLSISEVPIIFTERRNGQSKMSKQIVREAIWLVWRLRIYGK